LGPLRSWECVIIGNQQCLIARYVKVFRKNVDKAKVEVKDGVDNFFNKAFQKFHIAICFCMKLEDVFPMLMPKSLLN
jgi:hypothetical protein